MVKFKSKSFFYFLVGVLGLLIAMNVVALVIGNLRPIVPILIMTPILYLVWTRHAWTRPIVKVWSAFLMIGGGFGALSGMASPTRNLSALVVLVLGAVIYWLSGKYILTQTEVEVLENS